MTPGSHHAIATAVLRGAIVRSTDQEEEKYKDQQKSIAIS